MADLPATLIVPTDDAPPPAPASGQPAGGPQYVLTNTSNPALTVTFTAATEVTIGRDATSNTLSFPEVSVLSRRHCRVFTMGRDVFVQDSASNGTFVNEKPVGKGNTRTLRAGDLLSVVHPKLPDFKTFSWRFVAPSSEDEAKDDSVNAAYELGKVLGTGNFATVKLGVNRRTGEKVAVKIVEKKRFAMQTDFSFSSLQSEVEILRKMNHPNIIRVVDVFDSDKAFTMALELVSGGDLFDYIVGRCPNPFAEADAKVLFVQLLEAMLYMHSKDVVHRDLKPENILVHVDPAFMLDYRYDDAQKNAPQIPVSQVTLKVTDFGLAKFCAEQDVMSTMCGTPSYLAPEVRVAGPDGKKAAGYSWSVDVWSLGVILYILLSGTPPKSPESGIVTWTKPFDRVSEDAKALVKWMLQCDPRTRADLSDIIGHKWLEGVTVAGRELAAKKDKLQLASTMMLQPSPTVPVQPQTQTLDGAETEGEDDGELCPPPVGKRAREKEMVATVQWQWKCDLSLPDGDPKAWRDYDKADSDNIEKMQGRGVKTCRIGNGDYRISFEGMFQYNKADTSKQRPVRRTVDVE